MTTSLTISALIAFNIAILGTLAAPGPGFMVIMRAAFTGGRREGILCGLGLSLASVGWSLMAILGLSAVFAVVPWAYTVLKIAGAAYLIWFAISLWRKADQPVEGSVPQGLRGFWLGFVTNMANPKLVVFLASIFTTVLPVTPQGRDAVLILGNHLLLEVTFYCLLTTGLTIPAIRQGYTRLKKVIDRVAAAILSTMALRIAT